MSENLDYKIAHSIVEEIVDDPYANVQDRIAEAQVYATLALVDELDHIRAVLARMT